MRFFMILLLCLSSLDAKPIWNLGLAMDCDVTPFRTLPPNYQTSPTPQYAYPENYIKGVKEGDIIWLQTHQVARFVFKVLPYIQTHFFLYINDGDRTFPASYRTAFDVDALIRDPRVIHIFGQNVDYSGRDGKVSGIPIGVDFHTVAHSSLCRHFGETRQTVEEQMHLLEDLLATLKPTSERIPKAYVDFHLNNRGNVFGESRAQIFQRIYPSGVIDFPQNRIPRHELWAAKGQYAFSISPHGAGLDCHRTWEDLLLGCIVIVKTSPLDPLYEGLPVVIVKDWSEITRSNLNKWLKRYGDAFTNPRYRERLTHEYWMNVMRAKQRQYLQETAA